MKHPNRALPLVKMELALGDIRLKLSGDEKSLGFVGEMDDGNGIQIQMNWAMTEACAEVNKSRATFRQSNEANAIIGDRFQTHPERKTVEKWLRSIKRVNMILGDGNMEDFSTTHGVIFHLCAHVITEWNELPKRTVKEHRIFNGIEKACVSLRDLIVETGAEYYRAGGHGLRNASISSLLIPQEENLILEPLRNLAKQSQDKIGAYDPAHDFPTVEDILLRFGQAARRLADDGPVHSQPKKRGARTGYFVRRMGFFLNQRYGEAPPSVLSALASIALNEVVDEDLARKHLSLAERSTKK